MGSHSGSGHTDTASTCSYANFLAGHFNAEILRIFGADVLDDVRSSVCNAESDPLFGRRAERSLLDALSATPLDARLAGLLGSPPTEKGSLNYGNAGGYKTLLRSDTLTLTLERDAGFLTPRAGGERINFQLPGFASDTVAWQDHFYTIVHSDIAIITPTGKVITEKDSIFGDDLRIITVNRWDNIIVYAYRWFQNQHPRGWLVYELGKGFTGRWVKNL